MKLTEKRVAKNIEQGINLYMVIQQWVRVTKKIEEGHDKPQSHWGDSDNAQVNKDKYLSYYKDEQGRLNGAILAILSDFEKQEG